jgi:hypothetical protein
MKKLVGGERVVVDHPLVGQVMPERREVASVLVGVNEVPVELIQ